LTTQVFTIITSAESAFWTILWPPSPAALPSARRHSGLQSSLALNQHLDHQKSNSGFFK
jgi:hypothetical protein